MNQGPNGQVIQWAKVREEDNFYPDVIFELDPHFSVGRSLFCPLLEKSSHSTESYQAVIKKKESFLHTTLEY
jgi:hypothetical protein